ncbi:MAG: hypothetical protein L6Q34_01255 [Nitrospira sp.]|nr:MAG: hypothetical protein UZ03_NOB001003100 [Nitrospira sp. OLB3]MCK6492038.1 hypothetical protein [Nitrospira sp.]RIK60538.1 MAG: hypothetical protein DCC63_02600 [Nitrospira sp.]
MRSIVMCALVAGVALCSGGCGVYMAYTQPPQIDVDEFRAEGTSRNYVMAKLGPPTASDKTPDGGREDVYQFYEGSDPAWKAVRGTFHLLADLFTIALWEIVATPMEYAVRGDKITARARFDSNERLISMQVLGREIKPLEKIHRRQNGTSG